jgi:trehalose synthase
MKRLTDYDDTVGKDVMAELREKARPFRGATVVHVNAVAFVGGVAEMLDSLVPLMNDLGIRTDWRVIHGIPDFFEVTKKFHNTLQGQAATFNESELELYLDTNEKFAQFAFLDHDFVIIHDPQPCALVHYVAHTAPWIWRCHIDISHPNAQALEFLAPYINEYNRMIVSADIFRTDTLEVPQVIVSPSIDPLSPKNRQLPEDAVVDYLSQHGIPTDKPLVTQVSRFDPWKDPQGVLKVYERIKDHIDCRLVFCYSMASDDPEGARVFAAMEQAAQPYLESGEVIFVQGDDPLFVNALQRASRVILQKSTREGFGLTVTEAMWKGTPVVASNVGGIPTQMVDGSTGYLVEPDDLDDCAQKVITLLLDKDLASQLGTQAQEHVRQNFLITRHLIDYLDLLASL